MVHPDRFFQHLDTLVELVYLAIPTPECASRLTADCDSRAIDVSVAGYLEGQAVYALVGLFPGFALFRDWRGRRVQ